MVKAKLERALQRGGMAERRTEEGYMVWRCRNKRRRALGVISIRAGDKLRADGTLRLIRGEQALYEWAEKVSVSAQFPPPVVLPAAGRRAPRRDVLSRALDEAKDERERARLADAASCFTSDFERAAQPHALTMNWSHLALGKIDASARPRLNLPSRQSAMSARRLEALAASLGEDAWQLLQWVLVREFSCREVSRQLGISPAATIARTVRALRDVADIYDQKLQRTA